MLVRYGAGEGAKGKVGKAKGCGEEGLRLLLTICLA